MDAKVLWTGVGQKLPQISSNQRLSEGSPSVTENLGTKSYGDVGIEVEETRRRCINPVPAPGLALGASFARCAVPRLAGSLELGWIKPELAEGIVVEQIPGEAKLIFVCPSNQFPLGITMSAKRRRELHEFARSRRALIIEDDYDGEFRTKGEPLKAIYSQEPADLRPIVPNYGTHVSAEGNPSVDWDAVAEKARANRIQLHSLSRYHFGEGRPGLLFAVGAEPEARLRLAVDRLSGLVR